MNSQGVSFLIPAYNCANTIVQTVESIFCDNIFDGDEIVICDDCSKDGTGHVLTLLQSRYQSIKVVRHIRNRGGAAARNTAAENSKNGILFCLDSDNVLMPGSIRKLKNYLLMSEADVAAFQELHYFRDSIGAITHKWIFKEGQTTFADYLSGIVVPGASGNYMFTKKSWLEAGGYPEYARALDAWGFGLRQVAANMKMVVMPGAAYYHRYGHKSYWVRESKKGITSLIALQLLIPFLDQIHDADVDYIMSRRGRYTWFENLDKRPLRLKSGAHGKAGRVEILDNTIKKNFMQRGFNWISMFFSHNTKGIE